MARVRGISLNVIFLLLFLGAGCKAQNSSSLSPGISHRILTEIRSRYSVPQQVTITLSEPTPSDIPGYDALQVTFVGGTKPTVFDFLLSKDRKTIAHIDKIDISQDIMSKIDVKGRPVRGKADAKVTIVNYDDFQCPFCSRMHSTLFPGLLDSYGDKVRIIYKDYPLVEIHPWAMHAAVDANCLGSQSNDAYWTFADYVHGTQQEFRGKSITDSVAALDKAAKDQGVKYKLDAAKLDACVKKQDETDVRASMAEAETLGVDSTPTLFINGEKVAGVAPVESMHAILDRALAESGQSSSSSNAKK